MRTLELLAGRIARQCPSKRQALVLCFLEEEEEELRVALPPGMIKRHGETRVARGVRHPSSSPSRHASFTLQLLVEKQEAHSTALAHACCSHELSSRSTAAVAVSTKAAALGAF